MEILNWILAGGAGALLSVIGQVLFMRSEKRIKNTEADSKEFEYLEKQIEFLSTRVDELYKELGKSDEEKRQSRRDLDASEAKRYKLKRCISAAHKCPNRDMEASHQCPVLEMQRRLEEDWISQNKTNEDK